MKTYLITGGAGFIGSNFIKYILKKYEDIIIINLDKMTYAANLNNLREIEKSSNYAFIKGDICNKRVIKDIFKNYDVDYVVNFAAETHVDRSIKNPGIFTKTNILGTQTLLDITREAWKINEGYKGGKKYLQISTDEVYGSLGNEGFFTEKSPINPHSPYSASKASADLIVKSYYDTYRMPINITRSSNNYGPNQFPEKLIPLIIKNAIEKKAIPIYGNGLNIRDWIYVEDNCEAIDLVIRNAKAGEIYNIGANNERKNISIAKEIIKILNKNYDNTITEELIKYVEDRKGHDFRYAIDAEKIKTDLDWKPKTEFTKGLEKTIKWYLNNKEWYFNY
ncbi:dTDP-glucose 4,6-dehydratase [Fervidicella metallireducens]|uniref:dTDP-glucose 4,6-dehydratase n=1 Tax=Fervidicella metallireducens TaxID=655338 RepID=UPI00068900FD|nr:dTDP-glucose 4,6-dehydratase [Fervidicella metallireducens]